MGQRAPCRIDGRLDALSSQAATETDQTAGIIPGVPWRVKAVEILPGYRLAVVFQYGTTGVVDLSALTTAPDCGVYKALRDPAAFE